MTHHRRAAGLAALASLIVNAAVLLSPRSSVAAESTSVKIAVAGPGTTCAGDVKSLGSYCYQPPSLTVASGTTVTWTNDTGAVHTVTRCPARAQAKPTPQPCAGQDGGTGGDTGFGSTADIPPSRSYTFTFTSPGTYVYYSAPDGYAALHGDVSVTAATPSPASTPLVFSLPPGNGPPSTAPPSPTPTPAPTPSDTPSPSDTGPVALVTPSSLASSPTPPGVVGAVDKGGGGSSLLVLALVLLALSGVGALAYRQLRSRPPVV